MNTHYDAFTQWLAHGERGISSNTIATVLSGMDCLGGVTPYHPIDGADFMRCEKLLDAVPDFRNRFHIMQSVSPEWNTLVGQWDDIKKQSSVTEKTAYIRGLLGTMFGAYHIRCRITIDNKETT